MGRRWVEAWGGWSRGSCCEKALRAAENRSGEEMQLGWNPAGAAGPCDLRSCWDLGVETYVRRRTSLPTKHIAGRFLGPPTVIL